MTEFQYEVEGLYGDRKWDHLVTEDTPEAAKATLREYDENEPQYRHRVRKVAVKDPAAPTTYKVVRMYEDDGIENEVIKRGLTLDEAQAHCKDPETSSSTAQDLEGQTRTAMAGRWFDAYVEE